MTSLKRSGAQRAAGGVLDPLELGVEAFSHDVGDPMRQVGQDVSSDGAGSWRDSAWARGASALA